MFSVLVFCKDCDITLVLHRAHTTESTKNNSMCSTYKKRGKDECTSHYIRESQLTAIILDDLRRVTNFAKQQEPQNNASGYIIVTLEYSMISLKKMIFQNLIMSL